MKVEANEYERERITDQSVREHANNLMGRLAELLKPYGREHVGSLCFHFYAGTNLATGMGEIQLVSEGYQITISSDAAGMMLPELRDKCFELLGGKKMALKPQTVQEVRDTGGDVIKSSMDH